MPNIQNILTKEEKIFIKSKGLDISDFFDARGLGGYRKYHDIAKAADCHFVISNFCSNGHRLKDRHGHCIMCRPTYTPA